MQRTANWLELFTIYYHPSDYPNHFVLRRHIIRKGDFKVEAGECELADSLEEMRSCVPLGAINIGRQENDDPTILEVWI